MVMAVWKGLAVTIMNDYDAAMVVMFRTMATMTMLVMFASGFCA